MGDYADMALDGTVCQSCGDYLEESLGFPVSCESCQKDCNTDKFGFEKENKPSKKILRVNCPYCKKRVKEAGLANHVKDSHKGLETNLKFTHII